MEFKDQLFVYEIISEKDKTVRVKRGAGLFGNETLYKSKISDIPSNDPTIRIPATITHENCVYAVIEVGKDVFHDLNSMKILCLPKTIRNFNWSLWKCNGLKDIEIDSNNPYYTSVDGVLFTKDIKSLVAFPTGKTGKYIVPKGTKTIESFAFKTALISEIELPNSLITIKNNVFYGCNKIVKIMLPDNIKRIGSMENTKSTFVLKGKEYTSDEIQNKFKDNDC